MKADPLGGENLKPIFIREEVGDVLELFGDAAKPKIVMSRVSVAK